MSTNQLDTSTIPSHMTLSAADEDAVMTAISTIRQKMPFLIDLTSDGRKTLSKLGDKSHAFVKKAVDVATQNPEILPASHPLGDVRDTAQLFQSLAAIRLALQQLYKQVSDTATKVGSDAYAVARTIYAATKAPVAGPNLTVAADNLGKRFGRKSRAAAAAAQSGASQSGTTSTVPSTGLSETPPKPQA